jgi:hypothetical protein
MMAIMSRYQIRMGNGEVQTIMPRSDETAQWRDVTLPQHPLRVLLNAWIMRGWLISNTIADGHAVIGRFRPAADLNCPSSGEPGASTIMPPNVPGYEATSDRLRTAPSPR